jgi:hypothetical protein
MIMSYKSLWACIATMLLAALPGAQTSAEALEHVPTFRGVLTDITNEQGESNRYFAPIFNRTSPWYIDNEDSFEREGRLIDGIADVWRNGFVAPFEGVPRGPLTGRAKELSGQWMGSELYETRGGRVRRVEGEGRAVACIPWRITPDLGDDYLLSMDAYVAEGESVTLGYFGNVQTFGTAEGLSNQLGQLTLDLERGEGRNAEEITWTVAWDMNGSKQVFTSTTTAPVGEELTMQLGWIDDNVTQDDLFDATIVTSQGRRRLIRGNMFTAIEVFGFGFEMNGTNSYVQHLVAAVPEPNTALLLCFGSALTAQRLRRKKQAR